MTALVPAVAPDHLIAANKKAVEDRDHYGSPDVFVSVVSALSNKCSRKQILAAAHRLFALANTLKDGDGKPWRIDVAGKEYTLLDDAIFRAAARAPLKEADQIDDMKFDLKIFFDIALEESQPEGRS